jgi:CRISPR-associated endonuclease Csn1
LVYLPTEEDIINGNVSIPLDNNRIYKMVSCTGNVADFIPFYVANPIVKTTELGSNNKAQRAWTGEMIKEICIPLEVDRLGNIVKIKTT